GASQSAMKQSRLDDLATSAAMFKTIIPEIASHNSDGLLLIASNPVDVLTYAAWKWSGLPAQSVIGSGTIVDTSRFRALLGARYGIAPDSVHAYIIGEHGDSQVPMLSSANIAGQPLHEFCQQQAMSCKENTLQDAARQARTRGLDVLQAKGATHFG